MEESQAVTARHAELWKQRSGRFSRAVFWSLSVLGVLVVGFFEPHEQLELQLDAERAEAQQLREKTATLKREYDSVEETARQVRSVHARIKEEPWKQPVDQLKATLRRPRIAARQVEQEADRTIRRLAESVKKEVLEPLRSAASTPELRRELDGFERDLEAWKNSRIGDRDWYATITSKDRELAELTSFVSQKQQELTRIADAKLDELKIRQDSLRASRDEAESELGDVDAQIESLEQDVTDILPSWMKSIAHYESVVQLEPWFVLCLMAYLGLLATQIRASFVRIRTALYFDGASHRDPNLSSLWTAVYRGPRGSLATVGAYLLVIGALVYLFVRGSDLVGSWASRHEDEAWWISTKCLPLASWLVPLLAIGAVVWVAVTIARDRREEAQPIA